MKEKILQLLPTLISGGVERGTLEIAKSIVQAGGEAFVASAGGAISENLKKFGARHIFMPLNLKSPWCLWKNSLRLRKLIQKENIQLVHARSRGPAWSAYFACRSLNIPFITTFHGTYGGGSFFKRYYNSVMVRGDKVIAVSQFIKDHIAEHYTPYLNHENAVRLIFRGVDLDVFNPKTISEQQVKDWKNTHGLSLNLPTLVMPARLTRWKGQIPVLQAFQQLKTKAQLVFVGDHQKHHVYLREIEQLTYSAGLRNVHFIPHTCNMPLIYQCADIVLHASTDPEAFGRVVAEAQAMGRPVIVSSLGAPREIILEGRTGWSVNPDDSQAMAQKIDDLLTLSPVQKKEISVVAQCHIQKKFSLHDFTEKTLRLYQEVLSL